MQFKFIVTVTVTPKALALAAEKNIEITQDKILPALKEKIEDLNDDLGTLTVENFVVRKTATLKETQMKALIFYLLLFAFVCLYPIYALRNVVRQPRHATWTGERWSCPAGQVPYADEDEALAGKQDYVYCVR